MPYESKEVQLLMAQRARPKSHSSSPSPIADSFREQADFPPDEDGRKLVIQPGRAAVSIWGIPYGTQVIDPS
eukprot:s1845_g7.t1